MRACYEGTGGEDRKISWRMALYLEGKIPVDANDLSPKEATEMSRDIGPFPPPELPGLFSTTGLSVAPDGPACLSRVAS